MSNVHYLPTAAYDHVMKALEPRDPMVERDIANLRASRREHFDRGCYLLRTARQASESAREAFEMAENIEQQLAALTGLHT